MWKQTFVHRAMTHLLAKCLKCVDVKCVYIAQILLSSRMCLPRADDLCNMIFNWPNGMSRGYRKEEDLQHCFLVSSLWVAPHSSPHPRSLHPVAVAAFVPLCQTVYTISWKTGCFLALGGSSTLNARFSIAYRIFAIAGPNHLVPLSICLRLRLPDRRQSSDRKSVV